MMMNIRTMLLLFIGLCLSGGVAAKELPQVLLLGDSIRMGYQAEVKKRLAGVASVEYPDENCGNSEVLREKLDAFLAKRNPAVVCLSVGSGDIYTNKGKVAVSQERFIENLKYAVGGIRAVNPDAKIIFVSITPVDEAKQKKPLIRSNRDIARYNEVVKKELNGIVYLDISSWMQRDGLAEYFSDYGTGLNAGGRELLGERIAAAIRGQLPREERDAAGSSLPEILLLGDSIRMNYLPVVRTLLTGKANVLAPVENCRGTVYIKRKLPEWLEGKNPEIIYFNSGLHDIYIPPKQDQCAVSPEDYRRNLTEIVEDLKTRFPRAKLIFALTTPVDEKMQLASPTYGWIARRSGDVGKYNEIARDVMSKHGVAVDDFTESVSHLGDGIHLNQKGKDAVGAHVAEQLEHALKGKE